MVCAPVRSIITSLQLGDYLSVQAHKPCSISHVETHSIIYQKWACIFPIFQAVVLLAAVTDTAFYR